MPGAEVIPRATVLDASVAVRWLAMEPGTAAAVALMGRPTRWVAPRLLLTEVAGALHRKVRERRIRDIAAQRRLMFSCMRLIGARSDWPRTSE